MPVSLKITASNIQKTIRGLDRTQNRLTNLTHFWRPEAVPIIQRTLRQIFDREGPGWAPLSQSTLRSRLIPNLPILQQTGALMASVVDHPFIETRRKALLFGTENPYAHFHEFGTSRMPARPFLGPAIERSMIKIRQQYLNYIRQDRLRF